MVCIEDTNIWYEPLTVLFHSIGRLVRLEPDARDERPTPQKWSEKSLSDRPRTLSRTSDRLSPGDKMSPMLDSLTNEMVFHEVPSNVHSFSVSH